ncbi:uncharacterized protein LOC581802 [Strongylocentrotus purpuratus]|uniref:Uncharacterized protein n=1 Tax=Strongylocentrotus purpuratus TaxID=7668 RepID=A0A7M7PSI9_STRPU|nr:uncharacterized protein LOC581802 [Strongylocentrotus purpuratus]XP_786878.2 uncharacterized protein LOC581802 [Strongylocentrotus purpuratus]|eukprot:XP_786878.2 PREDICTED: uncharacterized protein LOC581802 [Strongylocentrotus purpuratus]
MPSKKNDMALEEGSPPSYKGKDEHDKLLMGLTVLMVIIYCGSLVIPTSERWGWLPTSVGNASGIHPTEITPAGWAFSIWILIFMWQMLWLIYALVNLCRRNEHGPVYLNPPVISVHFVVGYTVSLLAIIAWYFVWTNLIIWGSLIVIAIIPVSVWSCIAFLTRCLVHNRKHFTSRVDLWIYRILVLNGLAIFGTWTALATHINIAMVFIYDFGLSIDTGSTIALVIVLLLIIVYAFLDLFLWDRYLRYNVMSFPVVIWAVSAILDKRQDEFDFSVDANFILAAILLSVGVVAFLLKVVLLVVRSVRESQRQGI